MKSKKGLGSYIDKAVDDVALANRRYQASSAFSRDAKNKAYWKHIADKRTTGIKRAAERLNKEETEVNESHLKIDVKYTKGPFGKTQVSNKTYKVPHVPNERNDNRPSHLHPGFIMAKLKDHPEHQQMKKAGWTAEAVSGSIHEAQKYAPGQHPNFLKHRFKKVGEAPPEVADNGETPQKKDIHPNVAKNLFKHGTSQASLDRKAIKAGDKPFVAPTHVGDTSGISNDRHGGFGTDHQSYKDRGNPKKASDILGPRNKAIDDANAAERSAKMARKAAQLTRLTQTNQAVAKTKTLKPLRKTPSKVGNFAKGVVRGVVRGFLNAEHQPQTTKDVVRRVLNERK